MCSINWEIVLFLSNYGKMAHFGHTKLLETSSCFIVVNALDKPLVSVPPIPWKLQPPSL